MVARKKNEIDVTSTERRDVTKRYAVDMDDVLEQIRSELDEFFEDCSFDDFDPELFEVRLFGILEEVKN